jgi:hypothetical protein
MTSGYDHVPAPEKKPYGVKYVAGGASPDQPAPIAATAQRMDSRKTLLWSSSS